jgi:hypothetical protein
VSGAPTRTAEKAGFQPTDAPARVPMIAIGGVFALILLTGAAAAGLLAAFGGRAAPPRASAIEQARLTPPPPRLESDPAADLAQVQRSARSHLSGYGWTDQSAGVAHIPIERAMALQASRGWPDASAGGRP